MCLYDDFLFIACTEDHSFTLDEKRQIIVVHNLLRLIIESDSSQTNENQVFMIYKNEYDDYLNGLNLTISSGEYKDYKLQFELTFYDADIFEISKANDALYEGFPIGNSISKGNSQINKNVGFEREENQDGSTSVVGGFTQDHKWIVMNVGYYGLDTKMNRIHELFHTFGLSEPEESKAYKGIMSYPPRKPNNEDASNIANSSFLPVINKKK